MNKKQIEKMIKQEAYQANIPDLKQEILAQIPNRGIVNEKKRFSLNFGVRFSYLLSFCIILLVSVVIIVSINNNQTQDGNTDNPTFVSKDISNTEKAYAKAAATSVGFVLGMDNGVEMIAKSINLFSNESTDYHSMITEINEYFMAVSRLLDEEDSVYHLEVCSDGDYMYKLTISNAILNDTFETVIYYNETPLTNNNKNLKLDEISTKLVGVIIQGDESYSFDGYKEMEEDECNVELTLKISDNNYVTVSQEIEKHEKEFEYKFHKGDKKHPYKVIEIEIEADKDNLDGKKDISIEIEEAGREIEIEFKYGKDIDNDHVDIKYHIDGDTKEFKVSQSKENKEHYSYDYKDNEGKEHNEEVNKKRGKR